MVNLKELEKHLQYTRQFVFTGEYCWVFYNLKQDIHEVCTRDGEVVGWGTLEQCMSIAEKIEKHPHYWDQSAKI